MPTDPIAPARREEIRQLAYNTTLPHYGQGEWCRQIHIALRDLLAALDRVQADRDRLARELEAERMRLAACVTAALGNTRESVTQRITQESPYWSASYGDVCRAVDAEISAREALGRLREKVKALPSPIEPVGPEGDTYRVRCQWCGATWTFTELPLGHPANGCLAPMVEAERLPEAAAPDGER